MRLDKALSHSEFIESRTQAAALISSGHVLLNNQPVKSSRRTALNEIYTVKIVSAPPPSASSYNLKLEIVFEDRELIVINKPSGLVVHPGAGHSADTLVNALIYHNKNLAKGFHIERPGIVHRIDKDTSGLIVVAKTDSALRKLAEQFKAKTTHRVYLAICHGHFKKKSGTLKSSLIRNPKNRKKFCSQKNPKLGKIAITHFKVINEHQNGLSLVECQLETGRTHQIRVHLSEIGHPIVSDPIYGSKKSELFAEQFPRLMLHAAELGFTHPKTNKKLVFRAPWPKDIIKAIKHFRLS